MVNTVHAIMKNKISQRFIMLIPALWAALFDITITIVYQPESYWSGNLQDANEANPIGALFMKNHVSGFFIISVLWIGIIVLAGKYLPKKWLTFFSLFVLICHTWGGSSWIMNILGFWLVLIYICINSYLFLYCQNLYHSKQLVKPDS